MASRNKLFIFDCSDYKYTKVFLNKNYLDALILPPELLIYSYFSKSFFIFHSIKKFLI